MTQTLDFSKYEGLIELSCDQANLTDGGSFWYDAAYLVGATAHAIWEFSKQAMEYQHSLPANLKK